MVGFVTHFLNLMKETGTSRIVYAANETQYIGNLNVTVCWDTENNEYVSRLKKKGSCTSLEISTVITSDTRQEVTEKINED
jgi:hypothetical protein